MLILNGLMRIDMNYYPDNLPRCFTDLSGLNAGIVSGCNPGDYFYSFNTPFI